MLAPSHFAFALGSQPEGDGGATHAPTGAPASDVPHTSPALAQSTRTSCPLTQPTATSPSQRLAPPLHGAPPVAQAAVPSAPVAHFRPNAAQSRLASLAFSHLRMCVPEAEQRGFSPSWMP